MEETSRVLSHVYQLSEMLGGEDGTKLDDAGVNVVDAAQQLLKTAEVIIIFAPILILFVVKI